MYETKLYSSEDAITIMEMMVTISEIEEDIKKVKRMTSKDASLELGINNKAKHIRQAQKYIQEMDREINRMKKNNIEIEEPEAVTKVENFNPLGLLMGAC